VTGLWNTLTAAATLLTQVRVGFVAGALAVYLISVVIVAFRWRLVLRALGSRPGMWDTLLTYSAGVFVGNVTPARTLGGDACRLALIRSRTEVSVKLATASILYDRASEVPAIAVLALLTLPTLRPSAPILGGIVLVAALLVIAGPLRRAVSARVALWHDALVGVHVGGGSVAAALGCSMLVWLQDIVRIMLVAAAFRVRLAPSQAATLTMLRILGGVVPVPGGIGVVEGGLIAGLVWFGIPAGTAAAITIVERAILYGCGTCIGALSLMVLGGRRVLDRRLQVAATTVTAAIALVGIAQPVGAQPVNASDYRVAVSAYEALLRADPANLEAGAAYRQLIIAHAEFDRAIAFFKTLAKAHHDLANVALNLGFAYIDKVPTAGRVRQAFLGKDALDAFGSAIRLEPTWLAYYTRGLVDLFYDGVFNRARSAVADFEHALAIQRQDPPRPYYVRTFMSLGDAYWKLGDLARARAAWSDGLKEFPGDPALAARLAREGRPLYDLIVSGLDANHRQDTSLTELDIPRP
jgi:uncharacterized membrane protein YbhN (UPF0104 family)